MIKKILVLFLCALMSAFSQKSFGEDPFRLAKMYYIDITRSPKSLTPEQQEIAKQSLQNIETILRTQESYGYLPSTLINFSPKLASFVVQFFKLLEKIELPSLLFFEPRIDDSIPKPLVNTIKQRAKELGISEQFNIYEHLYCDSSQRSILDIILQRIHKDLFWSYEQENGFAFVRPAFNLGVKHCLSLSNKLIFFYKYEPLARAYIDFAIDHELTHIKEKHAHKVGLYSKGPVYSELNADVLVSLKDTLRSKKWLDSFALMYPSILRRGYDDEHFHPYITRRWLHIISLAHKGCSFDILEPEIKKLQALQDEYIKGRRLFFELNPRFIFTTMQLKCIASVIIAVSCVYVAEKMRIFDKIRAKLKKIHNQETKKDNTVSDASAQ